MKVQLTRSRSLGEAISKPFSSYDDHAYAEDMGFILCEGCGTIYMPQPIENYGHECIIYGVTETSLPTSSCKG